MKTLAIRLGLCALLITLPSLAFGYSQANLRSLLERSSFNNQITPPSWPSTYQYDPVVHSAVASLYSREPARNERDWQSVKLGLSPLNESDRYYSGSMDAHFRRGSSPSAPFFAVFVGSYATWKRGSFTNQTVALLDQAFGKPNILVFAGVLTPEFLTGHLNRMPWDQRAMSRDLFRRIQLFKSQTAPGADAGIVGYSGGASVAVEMLAESASASERLFNLGAMAISPILHQRLCFEILDSRGAQSAIPRTRALTTMDPWNIWSIAKNFGLPGWKDLLALTAANLADFRDRFYNESSHVDLRDTLKAVGLGSVKLGEPPSYVRSYIEHGFASEQGAGADLFARFDQATDTRTSFAKIRDPLLIYTSADDPILSTPYIGAPQPKEITQALAAARANRNITVFNPAKGGHIGALVDEIYPELVRTFFSQ